MDTALDPAYSFLSHELKVGDTPYEWKDFKAQRLRKYPKPPSSLKFRNHIGGGIEGVVLRARADNDEEVAVKIYFHNEQPEPVWGVKRIFPFEWECRNCAALELISTSLRAAAANDRQILLHPGPKTRREAIRNLRAFSSDHDDKYRSDPPDGFEAAVPDVHINDCLGWMRLDGDQAWSVFGRLRVDHRDLTKLPWYFAMVYKFVPKGDHQEDVVRSQYNFFYSAGFVCAPYKEDNWRGSGILVDMADLVLPMAPEWNAFNYGRRVERKGRKYCLE
ncbi:hypothetical protein MAPG_00222 [Magnaporthiopsis poae ATCC 64411]|uniref:Protein kinase domain-containing protein n=1 Tax=Magnaporthiopsis poae (strain ATCC 64411 / 73-15) TaxID=644358 RepID=A0A0C4DKF3_MAGP6|nr:hypothetical protein MAPG_00222 [Magnaporthiopsis poae ATCC 64411]